MAKYFFIWATHQRLLLSWQNIFFISANIFKMFYVEKSLNWSLTLFPIKWIRWYKTHVKIYHNYEILSIGTNFQHFDIFGSKKKIKTEFLTCFWYLFTLQFWHICRKACHKSASKLASAGVSGSPSQKGHLRHQQKSGTNNYPSKIDVDKEEQLIRKRLPLSFPKRTIDFYITHKTDFKFQFERYFGERIYRNRAGLKIIKR